MIKKKKTVEFEEGWADELLADGSFTQEELNALMRGIVQMVETGEILADSMALEDLSEEEQQEIVEKLKKNLNGGPIMTFIL
jgi:hypothetical protein